MLKLFIVIFLLFILPTPSFAQSYFVPTSDGGYYQMPYKPYYPPQPEQIFVPTTDGGSYMTTSPSTYQPYYCYAPQLTCGISYGTDNYGGTCYLDYGPCQTQNPNDASYYCNAPPLSTCGTSYGTDNYGNQCIVIYDFCPTTPVYNTPPQNPPCIQDVLQCPDGSYVSRSGPRCEFAPCPAYNPPSYTPPIYNPPITTPTIPSIPPIQIPPITFPQNFQIPPITNTNINTINTR